MMNLPQLKKLRKTERQYFRFGRVLGNAAAILSLVLGSLFSLTVSAELSPMSDDLLAEKTGGAGVTFTLEGWEFKPLGTHPVIDPDDPPNFKLVYSANSYIWYADSTADNIPQLDFWLLIDRITTNPNACTPDDGDEATCVAGGGDDMLRLQFDLDLASRQVERFILENGGTATDQTKLHYFAWTYQGVEVDYGIGDSLNPWAYPLEDGSTTRYWDHDGTGVGPISAAGGNRCATQHLGTATCAYRGLSLHTLDSNSLVACDNCEGSFLDEVNIYGQANVTFRLMVYGRLSGVAP